MEILISRLKDDDNNNYILREDLIPYSFGGNKVRKAVNFFNDIEKNEFDYVLTYGSKSSNHARVVANLAYQKGLPCTIITTSSIDNQMFNFDLVKKLNVEIIQCDLSGVKQTIKDTIEGKKKLGYKPYFIQGGGHGNIGTRTYVDVYNQILDFEISKNIVFDYIFLPTGTGTTQAGLVAGNILNNQHKKIIGISIARKKYAGQRTVLKSVYEYLISINKKTALNLSSIDFVDEYIVDGYGSYNDDIVKTIHEQFSSQGLPLDPTYTGKAFWGMQDYIKKRNIVNNNILFVHTGGTPLFFDYLNSERID